MALNPNVPYEVFEGGQYIGLHATTADADTPALIRKSDYKAFEEKFSKLRHDTREILGKLSFAVASPKAGLRFPTDPLFGLSTARREMVIADLKKQNVGWHNDADKTFGLDADAKAIVRDLHNAKKGFHTAVYNVMGKPVTGDQFDTAGNLARNTAKAFGVPPLRKDALLARPQGLREDAGIAQQTRPMMPPRGIPMAAMRTT